MQNQLQNRWQIDKHYGRNLDCILQVHRMIESDSPSHHDNKNYNNNRFNDSCYDSLKGRFLCLRCRFFFCHVVYNLIAELCLKRRENREEETHIEKRKKNRRKIRTERSHVIKIDVIIDSCNQRKEKADVEN